VQYLHNRLLTSWKVIYFSISPNQPKKVLLNQSINQSINQSLYNSVSGFAFPVWGNGNDTSGSNNKQSIVPKGTN